MSKRTTGTATDGKTQALEGALRELLSNSVESRERLAEMLDANPKLVNEKLPLEDSLTTGDTLLERAVMEARDDKAMLLIEKGADLGTVFEGGRNILHIAAETLNAIRGGVWDSSAGGSGHSRQGELNRALDRFNKVMRLHGIITSIAERKPALLDKRDDSGRLPEEIISVASPDLGGRSVVMQGAIEASAALLNNEAVGIALLKGEMMRLRLQHSLSLK